MIVVIACVTIPTSWQDILCASGTCLPTCSTFCVAPFASLVIKMLHAAVTCT